MSENISSSRDKNKYWDDFYSSENRGKLAMPSQFAAFISQEAADAHLIIEVGCGSGRDSLFFARHGFSVVAIDGSYAAVETCQTAAQNLMGAEFICATVGTPEFLNALKKARSTTSGETVAYARFFLHAITDDEEREFFEDMAKALRLGDRLALEYRTVRDSSGAKATPIHYRRFVDPAKVFAIAGQLGFSVEYAVEGFGFAKFKQDDAYVARCIFRKEV